MWQWVIPVGSVSIGSFLSVEKQNKTKQKILQVQNLCNVIEQTILFAMITNSNFVTEQTTVNIDQKVVKEMRL